MNFNFSLQKPLAIILSQEAKEQLTPEQAADFISVAIDQLTSQMTLADQLSTKEKIVYTDVCKNDVPMILSIDKVLGTIVLCLTTE